MGGPTIFEGQTYCLRWNNHKSNLVEILDALIKIESYVDCTIVVDNKVQFKAHRVVLAANSPYFQSILQEVPMDHCSILFPGVQAFEMRALLDYMYSGEVNVTKSQIPKVMRIAEQLEVKGLFDMADLKEKFNKIEDGNPYAFTPDDSIAASFSSVYENSHEHHPANENINSSPVITTSTNLSPSAPPTSSSPTAYSYKSTYPNVYLKSPQPVTFTTDHRASWGSPVPNSLANTASLLSSAYETAPDMNPLKRKKLSSISSMLMNRDTPILRNVLAQTQSADSSQPIPLVCQPFKNEKTEKVTTAGVNYSNGADISDKKIKCDEPHSPYTDRSYDDDCLDSPQTYAGDNRLGSYGTQQQKPEWKRYKQYTRSDILQAIECVRNGMSALQASRKFGVPSRTLYDKVKKLGITTGRPISRTAKHGLCAGSGSTAVFSYSHGYGQSEPLLSSNRSIPSRETDKEHHMLTRISHPAASLLDPAFLQQAFENRGADVAGREALHAMALAAAAHAAVNGMSGSPEANGAVRSPSPDLGSRCSRSVSPGDHISHERNTLVEPDKNHTGVPAFQYERGIINRKFKKERFERENKSEKLEYEAQYKAEDQAEENDKVEDLSLTRKQTVSPNINKHYGVIIPAVNINLLTTINDKLKSNENSSENM